MAGRMEQTQIALAEQAKVQAQLGLALGDLPKL